VRVELWSNRQMYSCVTYGSGISCRGRNRVMCLPVPPWQGTLLSHVTSGWQLQPLKQLSKAAIAIGSLKPILTETMMARSWLKLFA
jgi:hypothetical protein